MYALFPTVRLLGEKFRTRPGLGNHIVDLQESNYRPSLLVPAAESCAAGAASTPFWTVSELVSVPDPMSAYHPWTLMAPVKLGVSVTAAEPEVVLISDPFPRIVAEITPDWMRRKAPGNARAGE